MAKKVSLRGVSLDEAVRAFVTRMEEIEREMGVSEDAYGIGSSVDKKNQAEADQELNKTHFPPTPDNE